MKLAGGEFHGVRCAISIDPVPLLAMDFLRELAADTDKVVSGFTPAATAALNRYPWPGNIRELRNAVERAILSCKGTEIDVPDLSHVIGSDADATGVGDLFDNMAGQNLDAWLEEVQRGAILQALELSNGVQVQAAKRLGISERSLWHRIKKLNIQISRVAG